MFAALGGASCVPGVPLREVVIEGGTESQQAAAYRALAWFDQHADADRVTLTGFSFGAIELDFAEGQYDPETRWITILDTSEVEWVGTLVRHELCHALDYQQGISVRHEAALSAMAEQMPNVQRFYPEELAVPEAFAQLCQLGGTATDFMTRGCNASDPGENDLLQEIQDEVWSTDSGSLIADEIEDARGAEIEVPFAFNFSMAGTTLPGAAWLDGPVRELLVDLDTGERMGASKAEFDTLPFDRWPVEEMDRFREEIQWAADSRMGRLARPRGDPNGVSVTFGNWEPAHTRSKPAAFVRGHDATWRFVPGCPVEPCRDCFFGDWVPFRADGQVWLSASDALKPATIRWKAITAVEE